MNCGTALSGFRLVRSNAPTVCTCCRYGSSVSRRNLRTILSPLREQVTYSQYRQMSLIYYLKKLPQRIKEFRKFEANVTKNEDKYPPDIAAFLWLISLNGKVRFTNGKWYTSEATGLLKPPPIDEIRRYNIDAIDAKETVVDYRGMAKIIKLKELQFISFEGCPYIDDNCLACLVHIQDSLTHLNINKCPQITEHGFPSLTRLRNLQRINMSSLPRVPHSKVVASMLEDVLPNLKVGVITEEVEYHNRQREKWKLPPPVSEEMTPKQQE